MKNYPFIDTDVSISIVAWKLTKNFSHIISDISIPGFLPHFGNSQRFKLNAESPSMSEKDTELLYCLIRRLLFTSEVTISNVKACVTICTYPSTYHVDIFSNDSCFTSQRK